MLILLKKKEEEDLHHMLIQVEERVVVGSLGVLSDIEFLFFIYIVVLNKHLMMRDKIMMK